MEQKLISVDVLKNKIFTWFHKDSQESNELDDLAASVIMEIDSMPAIDPVHAAGGCYCGECDRSKQIIEQGMEELVFCRFLNKPFHKTGFCSWGKKKEVQP